MHLSWDNKLEYYGEIYGRNELTYLPVCYQQHQHPN